jgi:anti-sigma factor RsiW
VTQPTAHLEHWTLDELAEGTLSQTERTRAEAHLGQCPLCTAELEASRALIVALDSLPRFEPSVSFADAVMGRVVLPAEAPEMAKARRRWLPSTRRGWMLVLAAGLAPLAPLVPFLAWVFSHPGVTAGSLWAIGRGWVAESVWGGTVKTAEWVLRSGMARWVVEQGGQMPGGYAGLLVIALMALLAVPVSGWAMVRLLRTPTGELAHAH